MKSWAVLFLFAVVVFAVRMGHAPPTSDSVQAKNLVAAADQAIIVVPPFAARLEKHMGDGGLPSLVPRQHPAYASVEETPAVGLERALVSGRRTFASLRAT